MESGYRLALRKRGIKPPLWRSLWWLLPLFPLIAGLIVVTLSRFLTHALPAEVQLDRSFKLNDIVQAIAATTAFAVTFYQWRRGREEASLEKYYDRLDLANKRSIEARAAA